MKNPCIDCNRYHPFCECEEYKRYDNEVISKLRHESKNKENM